MKRFHLFLLILALFAWLSAQAQTHTLTKNDIGIHLYEGFDSHFQGMEEYNTPMLDLNPGKKRYFDRHAQDAGLDSVIWFLTGAVDIPNLKTIFEYDLQGRHINTTSFLWKADTKSWEPYDQYIYDYDNQNLQKKIRSFWDEDFKVFIPEYLFEYYYKGDQLEEEIIFKLNSANGWDRLNSTLYYYDENGTANQQILYVYNPISNIWYGLRKWLFAYNELGQLENLTMLEFDYENLEWEYREKNVYQYNQSGDPVTIQVFNRFSTVNLWLENINYEFIYDESAFREEFMVPYGFIESTHLLTQKEYYEFELETESFVLDQRTKYYYSDRSTNTANFSGEDFLLYPNPSKDFLFFQWKQAGGSIEIISKTGMKLLSQDLSTQNCVYIGDLMPGLYYCVVKDRGTISNRKFIKG